MALIKHKAAACFSKQVDFAIEKWLCALNDNCLRKIPSRIFKSLYRYLLILVKRICQYLRIVTNKRFCGVLVAL